MSFTTTAPAPITTLSHILILSFIIAPAPIKQFSPILVLPQIIAPTEI